MVALVSGPTVANSLSVTIPSTGAGNCLIVGVCAFAQTTAVSGITLGGAAGNFGQIPGAVARTATGGALTDCCVEVWADPNCAGGQTAIVVSGPSSTSVDTGDGGVFVLEYSGLAATLGALKDQLAVTAIGANGTSWSVGPTGTTTQAAEAWVAFVNFFNAVSTITGAPWNHTTATGGFGLCGNQVTSSTGTATFSGTQGAGGSQTYAGVVVTLLPSSSPAAATPAPVVVPSAAVMQAANW